MDLTLGIVKENYDADNPGKLKVTLPTFADKASETAWLPVAASYAGNGYGLYIMPEKDDQVIVGFLDGDIHSGVILGSLWNKKNALPPDISNDKNDVRALITKGGHSFIVKDGDEGHITLKSKSGHSIIISDKEKKITITTGDKKQSIELDEGAGSVSVLADKKISLIAGDISLEGKIQTKGGSIKMEADNNYELKAKQLKVEGSNIKLSGQSTEIKGANLKVESSGLLTLKGSMTKIN
jgi:uncharacterized protein involved in type VI secretion and phage assembly